MHRHTEAAMLPARHLPFPNSAGQQLDLLVSELRHLLGQQLIGIYLHGSLALGSFNPARSDLDVLVIVGSSLSTASKAALGRLLLRLSQQPYPLELSVLNAESLTPWTHPAPFEFHYSEDWRTAVTEVLKTGVWTLWPAGATDHDLAGHVTVTRARGIALWGPAAQEVLPPIPPGDHLASVVSDVREALARITEMPEYAILNACRTLAYLSNGQVLSKREGGEWALGEVPEDIVPMVQQALAAYRATGTVNWEPGALQTFAQWVGERLPAK